MVIPRLVVTRGISMWLISPSNTGSLVIPLLRLGEWRCVEVEGVEEFRVGLTVPTAPVAPTAPVPGHL